MADTAAEEDLKPRYIEVGSQLEFSRMVCALERVPRTVFMHDHEGSQVLSVQMDILNERPVIYYVPVERAGQYLAYGIRGRREESSITDSVSETGVLYSPIVGIKSLPSSLRAGNGAADMYFPLELNDLSSLAKLSHGFEEAPPFPLFAFPSGEKWLVGVFMNFNEDGPSYFCHVAMDDEPARPFLRYATTNGSGPELVETPSDHGYSYIKIIRLKEPHPLVDYAQLQN